LFEPRVPVRIVVEGVGEAEGVLVRIYSPLTVGEIVRKLPLEGVAAVWDGEVYFQVPVERGEERAKSEVKVGTIAYWPMGRALCVFYGRTRPYSPVNVVGEVTKNLEMFKRVRDGMKIRVERMQSPGE